MEKSVENVLLFVEGKSNYMAKIRQWIHTVGGSIQQRWKDILCQKFVIVVALETWKKATRELKKNATTIVPSSSLLHLVLFSVGCKKHQGSFRKFELLDQSKLFFTDFSSTFGLYLYQLQKKEHHNSQMKNGAAMSVFGTDHYFWQKLQTLTAVARDEIGHFVLHECAIFFCLFVTYIYVEMEVNIIVVKWKNTITMNSTIPSFTRKKKPVWLMTTKNI